LRLAYLLVLLPAAIVGVVYFLVFRSQGMEIFPAPFLGAIAAFVAALLLVRRYQRRKASRHNG
jgi:hypothetical protein